MFPAYTLNANEELLGAIRSFLIVTTMQLTCQLCFPISSSVILCRGGKRFTGGFFISTHETTVAEKMTAAAESH